MRIVAGDRVGRLGKIRLGCSAALFDQTRTKILLLKRADNGEWCLPGGLVEPGESVAETCIREVWEETQLQITISHLVGVYSNPNLLVEYPDGNRFQQVSLCFAGRVVGGEVQIDDESTAFGFFTFEETQELPVSANSVQRIADAFANRPEAFIF